ncbi:Thioredoxin reductase [Lentzea fradiae]|uniref:Thioredoxin reductase n=1 Tax=Lentzea fradiae TaxID=200378 RepID=A0A1G7NT28_9PSEU|nr:NAD(P)/FAD-dependent oxidoreductase [Lentzea fradiae]SDF77215.1 Thioredoxin reductase [Lentzea fradiae]
MDELWDAVVIGGGAAGLNGAVMLARSRRSVVVVDSGTPRNAPAGGVHGMLGLDGIPPAELLERGRAEVRRYGGQVRSGQVVGAKPDGDAFTVTLADGVELHARRVLVATGLRDVLPDVPGLAEHWGRGVVHCPYCHGWEVRDEPIGVLSSPHHAVLFRQLTDDLVFFANGTELDDETRAKLGGIRVVETPVAAVESTKDAITGVRLVDGEVVPRRVIAVATKMFARTEGVEGLGLPVEDTPHGRRFVSGMAGTTPVKGVWVAGNATDLTAQVGASAAAGALAGAHMNADLLA